MTKKAAHVLAASEDGAPLDTRLSQNAETSMTVVHDNNLALALRYAASGKLVFPVDEKKQPLGANWEEDATTDPEKIRDLWRRHPNASVGTALKLRQGFDGQPELVRLA